MKIMTPRTLLFSIGATALLSAVTPAQDSDSGIAPATEVSIGKPELGGDWGARQGIYITITKTGAEGTAGLRVSKYQKGQKESLFEGEIKLLFGARANAGYHHPFVAEITIDKEKSIVPGCFSAGEGDPCGLDFYQLDNGFGRKLRKYFNLKYDDAVIQLRSLDPTADGSDVGSASPWLKLKPLEKPEIAISPDIPGPPVRR
jgi:hypothetical protein